MAYKKLIRSGDLDPVLGLTTGQWQGVRWNPGLPGTTMTRVGNIYGYQDHLVDMTVVALSDAGDINATVATWASENLTGALDGSTGQIMLRIPQIYYRETFDGNGNLCGLDISRYPLGGFRLHEKFSWGNGRGEIYVGIYEGSVASSKLQSISGATVQNTKTLAEFRTLATARGAGWHAYDFYTQHLLQMLFYINFANLNSQAVLPGYTEHTWDPSFERLTGRMDGLYNAPWGSINSLESGVDAALVGGWNNSSRVIGNRFLWIENLYGHCWKFLDGCAFDGRVGKPNTAYLTPNPTLFSSVDADILSKYVNMNVNMPAATNENYMQSMGSLFLPKAHGGDSSTYVTDYFWSYLDDATRDYLRVVIAGGALATGALAGVAARYSSYGLGYASSDLVSRLCFERN